MVLLQKKDKEDDYYQNLINAMLLDVKTDFFFRNWYFVLKDVSIVGNYERVNVDIVAIDVQKISAVSFLD